MRLFQIVLLFSGLSVMAVASTTKTYDADVATVLTKVSKCLPEFEDVTDKGQLPVLHATFVSPRPANPKIQINNYTVTTFTGGHMPGPAPKPYKALNVIETIDSSGPVIPDKPAKVSYQCIVVVY